MQTRQSNRVDAFKDVAGPSHKTNTRKRKAGAAPTETRKSKNQGKSNGVFDDEDDIIQKAFILEDIKMPKEQLGSYGTRSVICERIVAVRELTKYKIPKIVAVSGLEPICKIEGNGNVSLMREFFVGIDATTIDTKNESFITVVRGTRIEVTPDALAKFGKFNRPLPDEPQYPYKKGEKKPGWKKICKKMLKRGCQADERGILYLRDLERDFVFLHHMFWWNVHPKPPHRNVSKNQAHLLYAVYKGRKPDIALLWFRSIYAAYCNDSKVASLPLAVLLTNFMLNEHGIAVDPLDDWDVPKKPLGRGTIGKSEGQSKNHRVSKFPNLATVEGNNDLLLSLHEHISDALDLLMDMEARQVRMENCQKQIVRRVKRIEDKLEICNDDDDEDENDNETDGDDDDDDESEGDANHEDDESSSDGDGDDKDHGE